MSADVLTCRYRLTGPLEGAGGSYSGHLFKGGVTDWSRMYLADWEQRDRILCRFYAAEREVEGHGGDQQKVQSDVQPEEPVQASEPEEDAADGDAANPPARRGSRRKAAPES